MHILLLRLYTAIYEQSQVGFVYFTQRFVFTLENEENTIVSVNKLKKSEATIIEYLQSKVP